MATQIEKSNLRQLLEREASKCRSIAELGRKMGIKAGTLRTYISGDSYPEMENLAKIALYLGITFTELKKKLDEGNEYSLIVEESKGIYQINVNKPLKAEDYLPVLSELPESEILRLAKLLLDRVVAA